MTIKAATEVFEFLFGEDDDPVIVLGMGQNIVKMNEKAEHLFQDRELSGLLNKMDKPSLEAWHEFLNQAAIYKLASCTICLTDWKLGTSIIYQVDGSYKQNCSQYIVRFRKIYDKDSLKTQSMKGKYEEIFREYPRGLMISTKEGIIIDANLQCESIFGVSFQGLMGARLSSCMELLTEEREWTAFNDFPAFQQCVGQALIAGNFQFETIVIPDSGLYLTTVTDISESIELKKQLEHSVSLSNLGQLAASIAHELRNPMTSLRGFAQLLAEETTESGRQYVDILCRELCRMETILSEFLELSKPVERTFHAFSITSLLDQVVEFMRHQASFKDVEIHMEEFDGSDSCIWGNEHEVKKVFINIFKNAIEAMPNGGMITVGITVKQKNKVLVTVVDQGIGMGMSQKEKIFLPFFTSKKSGTGLGLYHASQAIEEHGGSIQVDSIEGKGTVIQVAFPICQSFLPEERFTSVL